jgi:hypothetical protein
MLPAENRWVGFRFQPPQGKPGEILTVQFTEMVGKEAVNGFSLGARLADDPQLIRGNLELHRSVMTRLGRGFAISDAVSLSKSALELLHKEKITNQEYLQYMRASQEAIIKTSKLFLEKTEKDVFSIVPDLDAVQGKVKSGEAHAVIIAYTTLLNKIDSFATMRQLSIGDTADISQTVRWQRDILDKQKKRHPSECGKKVLKSSSDFAKRYNARRVTNKDYPELVGKQLKCLSELGKEANVDLSEEVKQISEALEGKSLAHLQGAHRRYLIKFSGALK